MEAKAKNSPESTRTAGVDERPGALQALEPIDGEAEQERLQEISFQELDYASARIQLELQEYADRLGQRRLWSKCLLYAVLFIIFSDTAIVFGVGCGILSFGDNPYAIPGFIAGNLAEIFTLSAIVVNWLFPKELPKKP